MPFPWPLAFNLKGLVLLKQLSKASDDGSPIRPKKPRSLKAVDKDPKPNSSKKTTPKPQPDTTTTTNPQKTPTKADPKEPVQTLPEDGPVIRFDVSTEDEPADPELQSFLEGFETSDDEDKVAATDGPSTFQPGQDVGKIPKLAKTKDPAGADGGKEEPGVLYIGRIPHGFYEHEMRQYFSQFGAITKLRLSRNKRTGRSKHYAFIEFAAASTAEIVAKTMNNYLLFGHLLKCQLVPADRVHPELWRGANRRFKVVPWAKIAARKLEQPRTETEWAGAVTREQHKRKMRAARLKDQMGYVYDEPDLKKPVAPPAPLALLPGPATGQPTATTTTSATAGGESQLIVADAPLSDEATKRKKGRRSAKAGLPATEAMEPDSAQEHSEGVELSRGSRATAAAALEVTKTTESSEATQVKEAKDKVPRDKGSKIMEAQAEATLVQSKTSKQSKKAAGRATKVDR